MAQYVLRKVHTSYELAKFEDSDFPTTVYQFNKRGCSCPAGRRSCKHVKIVAAWKAAGEIAGMVFGDSAELLGMLNVQ